MPLREWVPRSVNFVVAPARMSLIVRVARTSVGCTSAQTRRDIDREPVHVITTEFYFACVHADPRLGTDSGARVRDRESMPCRGAREAVAIGTTQAMATRCGSPEPMFAVFSVHVALMHS